MEVAFVLLLQLGVPVGLLVLGGLVGMARERAHLADLAVRERALGAFLTTDLQAVPGRPPEPGGQLVSGNVVIASDYYKTFAAAIRGLVGGEVRALTPLMERGRREAHLRMVAEAQAIGADAVVNVRFETSMISQISAEVLCVGTAIRRHP